MNLKLLLYSDVDSLTDMKDASNIIKNLRLKYKELNESYSISDSLIMCMIIMTSIMILLVLCLVVVIIADLGSS